MKNKFLLIAPLFVSAFNAANIGNLGIEIPNIDPNNKWELVDYRGGCATISNGHKKRYYYEDNLAYDVSQLPLLLKDDITNRSAISDPEELAKHYEKSYYYSQKFATQAIEAILPTLTEVEFMGDDELIMKSEKGYTSLPFFRKCLESYQIDSENEKIPPSRRDMLKRVIKAFNDSDIQKSGATNK